MTLYRPSHVKQNSTACRKDAPIVRCGPGGGQALTTDALILTPHGWSVITDLARGCRVIGRDGRPTTVTGVYPQGSRPAFRVTTNDHSQVRCDGDHIWSVRPKIRQGKKHPEAWRQWTTSQLLDRGLQRAGSGARYYLPVVEPVQFEGVLPPGEPSPELPPLARRSLSTPPPAPALPIDPYLLGVLLGDGGLSGGSVRLSTAEAPDLIPLINHTLPEGVTAKAVSGSAYDWALTRAAGLPRNPLIQGLRELGLWGHKSLTKFIPQPYLLAPVDDRKAVLAGLLDTDGYIDPQGTIEYATSSPWLATDVAFLVGSLGGTTTTRWHTTTHSPAARILVRLPVDRQGPFRLRRKAAIWTQGAAQRRLQRPVRTIVGITPDGAADMVCISVDAADGLFVTNHFIVTHNGT